MSIIRQEQRNARDEPSRPRVDLNALGELLERAAVGVAMLLLRRRAAGDIPSTEPEALERSIFAALREVPSVKSRLRRRLPPRRTRRSRNHQLDPVPQSG